MFGEFPFGAGEFAGTQGQATPTPVTPATITRLRIDCKAEACDGIAADVAIHSLESATVITAEVECATNDCSGIAPDAASYSLQDARYFNGTPVSVVVNCPIGANCTPGQYPKVITYPPGTFFIPYTPPVPGEPINLSLEGCQSLVSVVLDSDASDAEIQAAVDYIIQQVAQQQAECDEFPEYPFTTTIQLSEISDPYACLSGVYDGEIFALVTPSSYPVSFSITGGSLPDGLALATSATTALISGTPTTAGSSTFTITATAANGATAIKAFTISVVGITTTSPLPNAVLGEIYSETLATTGMASPLMWGIAAGSLPAGLELNTSTGEIFGTATEAGSFSLTVFVQNSTQQCLKSFTLDVDVCLITTASPLPDATEGVAYSTTLAATDITGTLTWSIIAGSLPTGLSLNASTGEISGTPTVVATSNFTAQVVNGDGNICEKTFQLEVDAALPAPLAWWTMENATYFPAANTVTDSVSGLVMSQVFGDASKFVPDSGIILSAFSFNQVSPGVSCGLQRGDTATLRFNNEITILAWLKVAEVLPGIDSNASLLYRFQVGAEVISIRLQHNANGASPGAWMLDMSFNFVTNPSSCQIASAAGWHFFVITYSALTGEITMDMDQSGLVTAITQVPASGTTSAQGRFLFSASAGPLALSRETVSYDEVAIFDGIMSTGDRDFFWNSGAGKTYPY